MMQLGLAAAMAITLGAAPGDAPLVNDATQVVVLRNGTRTVVAMQPSYEGAADAFAVVIPVPATVQQGDIKVLSPDAFTAVDQLGAPRLVEYWEQDPCKVEGVLEADKPSADLGVAVESQATSGEYQISIVSAKGFPVPPAAEPLLRPYADSGMKLIVAKVDPKKVRRVGDRVVLSPLRFQYDSEQLVLPIRLGLANSGGTQDLIVDVVAPHQRFEVANYPNVTIPTNLTVRSGVRDKLGAFYAALFDATVEKHPGAVVTEYAGAVPGVLGERDNDLVLTRLHARYGKSIKDDLELKPAPPIAGGREQLASSGRFEQGAQTASTNDFQARYAIRHAWTGPITCTNPVRGRWGGKTVKPALDLASARRGGFELVSVITHDVPELGLSLQGDALAMTPSKYARGPERVRAGCGCETGDAGGSLVGAAAVVLWCSRRRRVARGQ